MTPRTTGHRGRPVDRKRDQAILQAALSGLSDLGYDRLTMDEIAARARASKNTIYRRWSSKASLVVDAVLSWREQVAPTTVADTGSLEGDLEAMAAAAQDFDESADQQLGVIVGLIGAAWRDAELMTALSGLFEVPRQIVLEVLTRAVERGEVIEECDIELIADALIGVNLLELLRGGAPGRRLTVRLIQNLIRPLGSS